MKQALSLLLAFSMLFSCALPAAAGDAEPTETVVSSEPTDATTIPETTVPEETETQETTVPEETETQETTVPEETETQETTVPEETETQETTVPEETQDAETLPDEAKAAGETVPDEITQEEYCSEITVMSVEDILEDPQSLLSEYVLNSFYSTGAATQGTTSLDALDAYGRKLYNAMKPQMQKVAAGQDNQTSIVFVRHYTTRDLGVSRIWSGGSLTQAAKDAVNKIFPFREVIRGMLRDMPYDFYWQDEGRGVNWGWSGSGSANSRNPLEDTLDLTYTCNFDVAAPYAKKNGKKDDKGGWIETDYAKTGQGSRAQRAGATARSVAEKYADLPDFEKLTAFKEYICGEVTYDHHAAQTHPNDYIGSDAWQLVNAFDGDPSTNIVCEGYSKAFQYLCDLSTFQGDVTCMQDYSGNHMWNIVDYHGMRLLADVTNSDDGSIGENGGLFLVPVEYTSNGYRACGVDYVPGYLYGPADINDCTSYVEFDLPAPVSGEKPVTSLDGGYFKAQIQWSPACTVFAERTKYTATVTLTPVGAPFTEDLTVSCSGKPLPVTLHGFDAVGSITFPATEGTTPVGWVRENGGWTYYHEDGTRTQNDWEQIGGRWYYFGADRLAKTNWEKLGSFWYYFGVDGAMRRGWVKVSGRYYYFDSNGHMIIGWKKISGIYYYFEGSGAMVTGWKHIGTKDYYFESSGAMAANKWIGSYYVGSDGAWIPGYQKAVWKKENGGWKYIHGDGSFTKNEFEKIGTRWYFFDADGYMVTGWKQAGKSQYYFDANGYMTIGWKQLDGKYYYFLGSGAMATGWKTVGGKSYYFGKDGVMAVSTWIGDSYVGADGAWDPTAQKAGWNQNARGWKYVHADGSFTKNDFEKIGSHWHYFDAEGYMVTGWKQAGESRYYFEASGYMTVGWKQLDGKYYYFLGSGAMATGWKTIGGKSYYFDTEGVMAVNAWIGDSYVGADGAWDPSVKPAEGTWEQDEQGRRFIHPDGGYTSYNFEQVNGYWYFFDYEGYMVTGWLELFYSDENVTRVFCFDEQGHMMSGNQTVDGIPYTFGADGALQGLAGGSGLYDVYTVTGNVTGTLNFDYAKQVLDMVNKERTSQGLNPLVWSGYLSSAAAIRAAECSVSFSHVRPDGSSCFTVSPALHGENIGLGYANPQHVMQGWMESQGHRENIMNPEFKTLSVGCFLPESGPYAGRLCWVQLFSRGY